MTYNDYDSSTSHTTIAFLEDVMKNLKDILEILNTNPEYLSVYTSHTAYANSSLTSNLTYYGTTDDDGHDSIWIYQGAGTISSDGHVAWDDTTDAEEYYLEMVQLLTNILNTSPYKDIDSKVITDVFRKAQAEALKTCQQKFKYDCPYGTTGSVDLIFQSITVLNSTVQMVDGAVNPSMVAPENQNWAGDSRGVDNSRISPQALVELTLYYFDKLLYAELVK